MLAGVPARRIGVLLEERGFLSEDRGESRGLSEGLQSRS